MIPLHQIQIPVPCHEDWNAMSGTEQARFCPKCQKTVNDLSQMTKADAQDLLDQTGMRVCVRLTRLADGRVMTSEMMLTHRISKQPSMHMRKAWHLVGRAKHRSSQNRNVRVGHCIPPVIGQMLSPRVYPHPPEAPVGQPLQAPQETPLQKQTTNRSK